MTELTETQGEEGAEIVITSHDTVDRIEKIRQAIESPTLLERASKLNKLSEVSQVALGMCLAIIKSEETYKEAGYDTFDQYYKQELGRSKGDISKLLKVGDFMIRGQFPEETVVPYTLLYTAITAFPDKEPEYILSAAQTNTMAEIMENRRDDAFGTDHTHTLEDQMYKRCGECGKFERV